MRFLRKAEVFGELEPGESALADLEDFADAIRSGDVPDGSVSVAIADTNGTVTITAGKTLVPVPVEEVDGEWQIASAITLLFGVGGGGSGG